MKLFLLKLATNIQNHENVAGIFHEDHPSTLVHSEQVTSTSLVTSIANYVPCVSYALFVSLTFNSLNFNVVKLSNI